MKYKILLSIFLLSIFITTISATLSCETYDDFSSGSLDTSKWEVRQDVEGQPFMDEYLVDTILQNFHTQQNILGDRRIYLVPKYTFTTGEVFEYDFNVVSKEGNYMQMDLLTGDQYIRLGIMGYINGIQGYDELGVSHIKIEFQENNLHFERTTPSNITLTDDLILTNSNGNYEFYIGSLSGHNGKTHIDFDNFVICSEEQGPTLEEKVEILEQRIEELESRTFLLESIIDKIVEFIKGLPKGLAKSWK